MKTRKKSPSDYPLLSFRASQEEKDEIMGLIDEIVKKRNQKRGESDFLVRKNHVAIEALKNGLQQMKKKK